ncbi:bile acid:sodium symporter family protein [Sulfurospirillum sp. T05]|uniref:Bile acid:sodium symporter family protein n=1 Tax=Sulfurospirillum tamanense TaxID=2813362 RepID=A0ABS2WUA0_9BACT|nr:bile acid:sodium symporter family protein [Sulfurospirillum tamanensis]MBN2964764.1 bile acid:sodium symporter family protein [Sulfurospirillum tamanensis]
MVNRINGLFPLWAVLVGALAYLAPTLFKSHASLIVPLLTMIMFFMGATLKAEDFLRALKRPVVIGLTLALQFGCMPLLAFGISKTLGFSTDLLVGMLLVGAVSGGTASNVMAYLAKADVALSITLTAISTILSVLLTPFLVWFYVGQEVDVNAMGMLMGIVKIVLVPVLAGLVCSHLFGAKIQKLHGLFALFSMGAILFIIAIVIALNQPKIATVGALIFLGVVLHNLLGLLIGYLVPKLLGYDTKTCRTIAIETGMQNSGLAVALAGKYFAATPLSALPGALFSVWHNISGSLLAGFWGKREIS